MTKKYVCIGGEVQSSSDGDIHYISGRRLMELYGLNHSICDCIEQDEEPYYWRKFNPDSAYGRPQELRPRFDGNYREVIK